jgi:hypothetical protein
VTEVESSSWLKKGYELLLKSVRRDIGMSSEVDHDDTK